MRMDGYEPDLHVGVKTVGELYSRRGGTSCLYCVPLLFEIKDKVVVYSESADIMVILINEFNDFTRYPAVDFFSS